ncbi:hypothetical protein ACQKL0_08375 [Peribacillus sp. NPDC097264]|uniref:hypothetical protein n=1 Tax=unclassified Peribacillus TaxID=2675266 RepID=UPI003811FFDC
MIWLFILLTVATYTFVMKHVLNNIQKPAKVNRSLTQSNNENQASYHPTPSPR